MPTRSLTQFEIPVVQQIIQSGSDKNWEYAAFLESANGPVIGGHQTDMRADGVSPSAAVILRAQQGVPIIIHHNHLSQESLSNSDWLGLNVFFSETFAHCEDGTTYWGRVLDKNSVAQVLSDYESHECTALNLLCTVMMQQNIFRHTLTNEATFFRKEVVNRAMRICGFVEYEFSWGSLPHSSSATNGQWIQYPVGLIGPDMDSFIDSAAAQLAKLL